MLPVMSTPDQREVLLSLDPQVAIHADSISIKLSDAVGLRCATKLVRRGMDLRLALPPDGGAAAREPDPVLLRLVAHASAAKAFLVDGKPAPSVAQYGKRHLWQLLRINWLAPDILAAIVNGTQPADLTDAERVVMRQGRHNQHCDRHEGEGHECGELGAFGATPRERTTHASRRGVAGRPMEAPSRRPSLRQSPARHTRPSSP